MVEKKIKHKVYDSVFNDLFSDSKMLLDLYKVLLGDKVNPNITEKDISLLESDKVFINDLYNDLSFIVDNELIIMVEAQSTYSKNIATRLLLYAAKGLEEYIKNSEETDNFYALYSEKLLEIPKIKLYTVYTGSKKIDDHYINLSDLMYHKELETDLNLRVKVIFREDKNNILGQYISFCHIVRDEFKSSSTKEEAIRKAIKRSQEEGLLEKYLEKRKFEVANMLAHSITTEDWIEYSKRKSKKEGIAIGEMRGKIQGMLAMGADNDKIIELTGATEAEILEIENEM